MTFDSAFLAALEVRLNCRRVHARWLRQKAAVSVSHAAFLGLVNTEPKRRRRSPDVQVRAPRVLDLMHRR